MAYYDYNEIEPIPLTEEWLVRFGFEKRPYNNKWIYWYMASNNFIIDIYLDHKGFYVKTNEIQVRYYEFLHQIQNYVYAITGTELTLNDK